METSYNNEMKIIIDILKVYNVRASEVLALKKSDIINSQIILMRGKKRSSNIIIRDRLIVETIIKIAETKTDNNIFNVTYNQLYYFIKTEIGSYTKTGNKEKNKAVTHQYRYKNSQLMVQFEDKKLILNHKSNRNVKFYNQ